MQLLSSYDNLHKSLKQFQRWSECHWRNFDVRVQLPQTD